MANQIRAYLYSYQTKLTQKLKNISFVALTTDLSRAKNLINYITLTIHFLDSTNSLYSLKIAHDRFVGQQTAIKIEEYLREKLDEYEIPVTKLTTITTDNGSDVKSAASKITTRISCVCHNINLIVKNSLHLHKYLTLNSIVLNFQMNTY